MNHLTPIKIPLLNPNETEALLVSLEIAEGESIKEGQVIAVIETTKSTGELQAESSGYLVGVRFTPGDTLQAGDVLAYIGETPDAHDPALPPWTPLPAEEPKTKSEPSGLRITAPARELALAHGIDLSILPQGPLVTREMVEAQLKVEQQQISIPEGENRLVIYGAGGHGRSLAALVQKLGTYDILGFIDDGIPVGETVLGLPVLGGGADLHTLAKDGVRMALNGIGGISDLQSRLSAFNILRRTGFHIPTVIHPTAFIEDSAQLADGVQVFPFAYIGTQVEVQFGGIVNTGAIVSHDCVLGNYVNLSPGATLAGGVIVGERALIGMRATVNLYVKIGAGARVGNGATVKADVPDGGVVPAGTIWPPRK